MTLEYDYEKRHVSLTAGDEERRINLKYQEKGDLIFHEWLEIFGYLERDGGVVIHNIEKEKKSFIVYPGFGRFVETLEHQKKRIRINRGKSRHLFGIPFRGS